MEKLGVRRNIVLNVSHFIFDAANIILPRLILTERDGRHAFRNYGDECLVLFHVDNASDAVTGLHVAEGLVDLRQWLSVGDKLINLQLASHVVVNEVRQLRSSLDTTKRAALPRTAGNKLKC